jgi:hypothetical protein
MATIGQLHYWCDKHKAGFGKQKCRRYCRRIKCKWLKCQPLVNPAKTLINIHAA